GPHPARLRAEEPVNGPVGAKQELAGQPPVHVALEDTPEAIALELGLETRDVEVDVRPELGQEARLLVPHHPSMGEDEIDARELERGLVDVEGAGVLE